MNQFTLHLGDCLESMRAMPDNSIDSICTDPPYGLSFMGKKWDYDVPGVDVWAECLRVLKPGGHLLAFAGTRTQHRMAVRIEDAGFEIRDMIAWVYGSGFPKSLDVSKAIDKAGGASPVEQASMLRERRESAGMTREQVAEMVGCTPSSVRDWEEGRARSTGSAIEFIVPSAEYRAKLADVLGYSSDERLLIGAADDRREDGTVYGIGHSGELRTGGHTDAARQWAGWGTALKPALEPITVARKPLVGTVAANVLEHGTGALNIDGCRVASEESTVRVVSQAFGSLHDGRDKKGGEAGTYGSDAGRWPANLIHDGSDEVVAAFPRAPGAQAPVTGNDPSSSTSNAYGNYKRAPSERGRRPGGFGNVGAAAGDGVPNGPEYGDKGSAARFFKQVSPEAEDLDAARLFYCAKASKADRNSGCDGMEAKQYSHDGRETPIENAYQRNASASASANHHPTVKPTDLMAYLVRLVTPPGGVVLDPFMGSGSTGKAAMREGARFIGCEMSPEYMAISKARIEHELALVTAANTPPEPSPQTDLFAA